jgi:hypothetical protein
MKSSKLKIGIGILHFAFCILHCQADLTVTVTPGYVFGASERPSTSTLNRLGAPTINISGTIGGTNAGIAAGSVNGTHFSDSVVDDRTIDFTNSSPRALRIKEQGVDLREASTNLAGLGLGGGGGFALSNKVDGVRLTIATDTLTFSCPTNTLAGGGTNSLIAVGPGLHLSQGQLSVSNFVSLEYVLVSGLIVNTNHGLGVAPSQVNWVLICKTAELGFAVGDEINCANVYNDSTAKQNFSFGANSTNVFISAVNTSTHGVRRKDNGNDATLTAGSWRAKVYARP